MDIIQLFDFFKKEGFYVDNIEKLNILDMVKILVDGDWHHDHIRCDVLMKKAGYKLWKQEETEGFAGNGQDCYAAYRYYVPEDKYELAKACQKMFS